MGHHVEKWNLFRLSDRKQFDDVSLETIEFFFRALNEKSRTEWLMWREGFSGWRPFGELPMILKHLQPDGKRAPAPPPVPAAILKYAEEVSEPDDSSAVFHAEPAAQLHADGVQTVQLHADGVRDELKIDAEVKSVPERSAERSAEKLLAKPSEKPLAPPLNSAPHLGSASQPGIPIQGERRQPHNSVSVRAIHAATSGLRSKTSTGPITGPITGSIAGPVATPASLSSDAAPVDRAQATAFEPAKSLEVVRVTDAHKPADRSARADLADHARVVGAANDEATLSLMLESEAATEDRNNVRYQKKFKVRIFTPKGIVTVVTIDCSTSGFRLREPLPAGLPRFFHVELDLGADGKIPLVCSEIREKDGRGATRVRIQVNDHMNVLKSALVRAA